MIDSILTIELPGERTRATVKEIINPNKVVVELTSLPMGANHEYKLGNFVECIRKSSIFGNVWTGTHKMIPIIEDEPIKEVKNVRIRRAKSDK